LLFLFGEKMDRKEYLQILSNGIPTGILKRLQTLSQDQETLVNLLEVFTERAGFRQYSAYIPKAQAEVLALQDTVLYYYQYCIHKS